MKDISQVGINLIKSFEGLRTSSYRDIAGVWTIGYGHTAGVKAGQVITSLKAEALLKDDLKYFVDGVNSLVKVSLNQYQFDSLVSFSFNLGLGNLSTSTLLYKLNQKDFKGAAAEFVRWNKARNPQTKQLEVVDGLTRRREAEKALFLRAVETPVKKEVIVNHVIKKGENLTIIAKAFGTSVSKILKLNPSIKDADLIYPNQKIKVPDNR